MSICPLYISQAKSCFVKLSSNERLFASLTGTKLPVVNESWLYDCEGSFDNCSFKEKQQKSEPAPEPQEEAKPD